MRLGARLPNYGGQADLSSVDEDIIFVGEQAIRSNPAGKISIIPGTGAITQIGDAGSSSHSLVNNDDLFVSGKLEVDSNLFVDSTSTFASHLNLASNAYFNFGSSGNSTLFWATNQVSSNTTMFCLSSSSKSIIFIDRAHIAKDFDHAAQTNPTVFVHSATDPTTVKTEWISFCHNVTDGVITTGKGALNLVPATNIVNIPSTLNMTSDAIIATTANGKLHLTPNGTGYTCIGAGVSGTGQLTCGDDLRVNGKIEVAGETRIGGGMTILSDTQINYSKLLKFGSAHISAFEMDPVQSSDECLMLWLDAAAPQLVLARYDLRGKNFDQSGWTDPVLLIFSQTDPDSDHNEWGGLYHDTTNFNIESGKGQIVLNPAGGHICIANATLGGTTVTHDDYLEVYVNGVLKKVMLGS